MNNEGNNNKRANPQKEMDLPKQNQVPQCFDLFTFLFDSELTGPRIVFRLKPTIVLDPVIAIIVGSDA